ncbi:MAG: MFS transporter [bacterium]|nr:MFS transporter [bacterium]
MTPFKRTFIALYMAIFMSSLGLGILSPILPAYVDSFSASSFVLGIVFGIYSAARTLFMPPVGILSDRFGRKPFILSGLLLFAVVSPLYALAGNVYQLMLVRFFQGIAAAMLVPVAMSAIGDLSPRGREGFIMGSFTSAFFAGLGFGPLIGGFMSDKYSMAAAFYSMGIMSLAALVFTVFALPSQQGGFKGKEAPEVTSGFSKAPKRHFIIMDRPMAGLFFFRFTRAVGIGLVWVIMPLYAVKSLNLSALQVGILLSVNTFITTLLQSPFGHLSDRFGHMKAITAGSVLAGAAVAFIGWSRGFEDLLYISAFLGVSGALIVPAGSALAVSLGRTRGMGRTMGLYNSSLSLGTMLGPVIGGALLDLANVQAVFLSGSMLGLLGLSVLVVMYPSGENSEFRIEN